MELTKIRYEVQDGVATIAMDSPANLNAIDELMADELLAALDAADTDPDVKVVVLKGANPKAFSAGGDIGYFYGLIESGGDVDMSGLIDKVGKVAHAMKALNKIIITSVSGAAAGAGASIALAGDFMICADNAKIILAFVKLGLAPDTGVTYLLSRLIGPARTMDLAVTGRPLGAQEALDLGLAYRVTSPEELEAETAKLAAMLVAGPQVAYRNIKRQVYGAAFDDYPDWLSRVEGPAQAECAGTDDFKEGCRAFVEKRPPSFQGR